MPSYYCKVCYDNNKPEKEYRSHNVRNEQGNVCCPVLQSSICTYCGGKGHGRKYCTIFEKDKRRHDAIEKEKTQVKKPIKVAPKETPKVRSKFAALEMSSDSDSEPENPTKETATKETATKETATKETATKETAISKPAPWATAVPKKMKWTDMYDSADEDSDEDN